MRWAWARPSRPSPSSPSSPHRYDRQRLVGWTHVPYPPQPQKRHIVLRRYHHAQTFRPVPSPKRSPLPGHPNRPATRLSIRLASQRGIWGPHLVVVPTSCIVNWESEFKRWCPAFKILTYYGSVVRHTSSLSIKSNSSAAFSAKKALQPLRCFSPASYPLCLPLALPPAAPAQEPASRVEQAQLLPRGHHLLPARRPGRCRVQAQEGTLTHPRCGILDRVVHQHRSS